MCFVWDDATRTPMRCKNGSNARLALKAFFLACSIFTCGLGWAADGSVSPNEADLNRIRLLRVLLASTEDTPPRLWRTVLSQLYSGRKASQRGLSGRLESVVRLLSALGESRAAVLGTCVKVCDCHESLRFVLGRTAAQTLLASTMLQDTTLPSSVPYGRLLVASNLKDNSLLLPQYILQLLITVGGALPEASTFVSVYESGSTDSTGEQVDA